jgi:class 3 adenylate cyclase
MDAAIGTVSNVASRLCDEAKPGQILISPRVRQSVEKAVTVEPVGEFALKGIRRPMLAYNVVACATLNSLNWMAIKGAQMLRCQMSVRGT